MRANDRVEKTKLRGGALYSSLGGMLAHLCQLNIEHVYCSLFWMTSSFYDVAIKDAKQSAMLISISAHQLRR